MKLYYSPGSCSQNPHIVLRESGLPFELVLAPTKTKKLPDGADYLQVNPKGQVPLLELDDGRRLTEGPAIVQYIADQVPDKGLAPAWGTFERYRLMEWLNFTSSELHKSFTPLFTPGVSDEYKAQARERLQQRLAYVDGQLAGHKHLLGEPFTVADSYLFVVSGWSPRVGVEIGGLTNLRAWRERITARPAVQAALKAEGF